MSFPTQSDVEGLLEFFVTEIELPGDYVGIIDGGLEKRSSLVKNELVVG